ncbi:MAG: HAMP domain-containing histidine kinase [Lachnospiraceae bacterium]|nr:HAMP domain-containing histidine kinase [Lachnospiraceae bacterium]
MKYSTYLKEHLVWAGIFGWLLFSIEVFLLTLSGSGWLKIYVGLSLTAAFFTGTYMEYRRKKRYLLEIQALTDALSKKYLLPEMLKPGGGQEERLLYDILRRVGKSMYEHVADYERSVREYKEYIELWIHEVKVPIAALRMILANREEENPALIEETDRIEGYVEQALYYARSSSVEKDYMIRSLTLQKLVEEVLLQKKRELLGRHALIKLDGLDTEIYSDGKWMAFILRQIVDNSIKYAQGDSMVLEFLGEEEKERVLLRIRDQGVGVKAEEVARVFDKGFTGANGRRHRKSTGIGLYLCKKLCGRLGHDILFTAEEGKGSEVTIIFPKTGYMDEVR